MLSRSPGSSSLWGEIWDSSDADAVAQSRGASPTFRADRRLARRRHVAGGDGPDARGSPPTLEIARCHRRARTQRRGVPRGRAPVGRGALAGRARSAFARAMGRTEEAAAALRRLARGRDRGRRQPSPYRSRCTTSGACSSLAGDAAAAAVTFADSLRLSIDLDHDEGIAYGLEGLSAIAAARRRRSSERESSPVPRRRSGSGSAMFDLPTVRAPHRLSWSGAAVDEALAAGSPRPRART